MWVIRLTDRDTGRRAYLRRDGAAGGRDAGPIRRFPTAPAASRRLVTLLSRLDDAVIPAVIRWRDVPAGDR